MPTVRIMLAPTEVMRDMYFPANGATQASYVKENLDKYLVLPPIVVLGSNGEAVAEECFDLTNNPGRQEERLEKYGNGRSLSVGDVVDIDGAKYACMSMGWEEI